MADLLVLVFTPGMSLRGWEAAGLLEREWALYRRIGERYGRVLLVSFGGADEVALASTLGSPALVVCNDSASGEEAYGDTLPERVHGLIGNARTVVVKTNQLSSGPVAVRIAHRLAREPGRRVALVARGGYPLSRFAAYEHGPHSGPARRAAADEQELCANADVVVGTTAVMLEDLCWRYSLDPAGTALVPNYVLCERGPVFADDRSDRLILYSGQLTRRKRVDLLIRTVAGLPSEFRAGAILRIIGSGPEEGRLKRLASECGARCEFLARMPHRELVEQMSHCAVYAQASELEGHPKTVLEAMAAGAPVVVANTPGLGAVVHNGVTGLRVAPDPASFAGAIGALLGDPEWRRTLGMAAAAAVRREMGLERVAGLELDAHGLALERCAGRARSQSGPAPRERQPAA